MTREKFDYEAAVKAARAEDEGSFDRYWKGIIRVATAIDGFIEAARARAHRRECMRIVLQTTIDGGNYEPDKLAAYVLGVVDLLAPAAEPAAAPGEPAI